MDPIKISIYNLTQDLDSNYLDSDPDPTLKKKYKSFIWFGYCDKLARGIVT